MPGRRDYWPARFCRDCTDTWLCRRHVDAFLGRTRPWRPSATRRWTGWHRSPRADWALTVVTAVLVGLAVATQRVAAAYHYHRALGVPWVEMGSGRLYAPWSVLLWHGRFGEQAPAVFVEAERVGAQMAALAFVLLGLVSAARQLGLVPWWRRY